MEISDPIFREAVDAIDKGDVNKLGRLISENPRLVRDHLDSPTEGYFKEPYLLWFIAGNPTRNEKLPKNIAAITQTIIEAAKRERVANVQHQVDYTLGLVSSGRVPRDCGVQLELIDLLVENGADPNHAMRAALIHEETDAVRQLLKHGAVLTLPAAITMGNISEAARLSKLANTEERQAALAVAALYGQADTLSVLISLGADVNAYAPVGYHSHATPLHHAVASRSLDAVKILVEAGADLHARDKIYHGLPYGWAQHGEHTEIVDYIRECMAKELAEALLAAGLIEKDQLQEAVYIIKAKIEA